MTSTPVVLGRLATVRPRDVWPHEALNFTPWLLENVDVLSELLNMDLVLDTAEHAVGNFSLDLIGRDQATGGTVIVENQLEASDHTHLGQILTYAAGTDPTTVVWVAAQFREEHRAALDWLNSRTDEGTRFFGVEIGVVRIGQSVPAPSFRLIVQPNDWEKTVRATTTHAEPSVKQLLYTQFWTAWIDRLASAKPEWSRATHAPLYGWFAMPTGLTGASFYAYFTKRGLSSELYFESPNAELNTSLYESLLQSREQFEQAYGGSLDWQPMEGSKATRIGEYLAGAAVTSESEWAQYIDWLLDRQTRLRGAVDAVGGLPRAR